MDSNQKNPQKISDLVKNIPDEESPTQEDLPQPPGKNRKKSDPEQELPKRPDPKKDKKQSGEKQKISPLMIVLAALATLLLLLFLKPSQGYSDNHNIEAQAPNPEILKYIQDLQIANQQLRGEIQKIQKERNEEASITEALKIQNETLRTLIGDAVKKADENRNYISTIYRQVLDIQLKMETIGGGFEIPEKAPPGRVINPYIGEDNLP